MNVRERTAHYRLSAEALASDSLLAEVLREYEDLISRAGGPGRMTCARRAQPRTSSASIMRLRVDRDSPRFTKRVS